MYFVSFPKINILLIHNSQIIKYFNIGAVVCVDTGTVGEPNSVTVLRLSRRFGHSLYLIRMDEETESY
jgi:hypothetical protein